MTNMNRDNFYTDIDKLLTLLINKSAEAKLEHYRTLKKVEKEVIELKSYIYTNYKAPI
jgi:preprotein translocase subunit Sec63